MQHIDKTIKLNLKKEFTSVKRDFVKLVKEEGLNNANLVCWVPHEVGALAEIGWEDGVIDDLEDFLADIAPPGKWIKHDEPDTQFCHNFFQHIRTKLVGTVSLTLIVKDGSLFLGKYQDLYYYSPVFREVPEQGIFVRVLKFD